MIHIQHQFRTFTAARLHNMMIVVYTYIIFHNTCIGSTMNAAMCGSLSNRAVNAGISLYGTVIKLGI
jgi:hypothetical protein